MAFKSPFSYYGSKSKIAHLYPAPRYPLIIEPFAGAAGYSMLWGQPQEVVAGPGEDTWSRQVWLNDLDEKVYQMWRFLQSSDAAEWIARVPLEVQAGQKASELIPNCPLGLLYILQAEANQGTQGARGVHDQITSMGAKCWKNRVRRKLEWASGVCQGWQVTQLDHRQLPVIEGTYYVDPPYNNLAGSRYRQSSIDYTELAEWCRTRPGQVIVAEQADATWLPFQPLVERRGVRSRYQKSRAMEGIWVKE